MINKNQDKTNTISLFKSFWLHLRRKRKFQIILLLILMIINSIAELISLASLIPFLTILSSPEKIWKLDFIKNFAYFLKIESNSELLLVFTIIFGLTAIFASTIRLTNTWFINNVVASVGSDLSIKAYKLTLYQPYRIHINRNSSKIISALSTQIDLTQYFLGFSLQLITNIIISLGIIGGIFIVDWKIAFLALLIIGIPYLLVIKKIKKIIIRNSKFITESMSTQVKNLQEGLGGIRDIIIDRSQKTFIDIYSENDKPRRKKEAENMYFQQFPKSILETIAIVFIAFICVVIFSDSSNQNEIITILGPLAFGAQKLLPAFQQIYSSWVGMKGNSAAANLVFDLLKQDPYILEKNSKKDLLKFEKYIELKDISYSYKKNKLILEGLNLTIKKGEIIGIIGKTGSGKSTLVDIIMGLIIPNNGTLNIDGKNLYDKNFEENLLCWRKNISHIPQRIFLKDATIYENIAFGIEENKLNETRAKEAAEISNIKEFIDETLGGFNKFVGEKGIRLSGGQIQRIGIARALYKKSQLLVLDEATSALDYETEKKIIDALITLEHNPTIIMIAHRKNSLINCDRIIQLENGKIINQGKPKDIIKSFFNQDLK